MTNPQRGLVNDQELTQLQETGEASVWVGVPSFHSAVAARNILADTLGIPREDVIPIKLEDQSPLVRFRVARPGTDILAITAWPGFERHQHADGSWCQRKVGTWSER